MINIRKKLNFLIYCNAHYFSTFDKIITLMSNSSSVSMEEYDSELSKLLVPIIDFDDKLKTNKSNSIESDKKTDVEIPDDNESNIQETKKTTTFSISTLNVFLLAHNLITDKRLFYSCLILTEMVAMLSTYGLATKNRYLVIIAPLISSILWIFNERYHISLRFSVHEYWKKISYEHFENVETIKKETTVMDTFGDNVQESAHALCSLISWGIPTCFSTIRSVLSILIVLCVSGYWYLIIVSAIIYYIYFNYIVVSLQKTITESRELMQKEKSKVFDKHSWIAELVKYGKKKTNDLMKVKEHYSELDQTFLQTWILVANGMNIISCLMTLVSLFNIEDWTTFLLIKIVFDDLRHTIDTLSHFTNNLACKMKGMEGFVSACLDLGKIVPKEIQHKINKNLIFNSVNISVGSFKLTHDELSIPLNNNVTLIMGPFGSGKTTLINALKGSIPGAVLTNEFLSAKNFFDCWDYMSQHLRSKLTTLRFSVRGLLDNEKNNSLIMKLVEVLDLNFRIKTESDIDVELEGLSGGQQMLFALLYVIYQFIKTQKQILVLDEPEQGFDSNSRKEIMEKLFRFLKNEVKQYNGGVDIHVIVIIHSYKTDVIHFALNNVIDRVLHLTPINGITNITEYTNEDGSLINYCKILHAEESKLLKELGEKLNSQ